MKLQIKHRWSNNVLFEGDADSILSLLKMALESRANLSGANLSGASLSRANLSGASLSRANLSGANLYGADLYGADLSGASLSRANLSGANLYGADLSGASLSGANLSGANLYGANLYGADLSGADLSDLQKAQTLITASGDITGWKKCQNGVIVRLLIPSAAERHNATGRKCRAEYAVVTEVVGAGVGISFHDNSFHYRAGETVKPHKWESDRFIECGGGIHFYITREEAEAHT
jgi:hypothetical protein